MTEMLELVLILGLFGITVYGVAYFIKKVGNDDEQD